LWWFHKKDRRGSKSGHVQAGSNLWDKDNKEPGRCGRSDLPCRGLWGRGAEKKEKTEMNEYKGDDEAPTSPPKYSKILENTPRRQARSLKGRSYSLI